MPYFGNSYPLIAEKTWFFTMTSYIFECFMSLIHYCLPIFLTDACDAPLQVWKRFTQFEQMYGDLDSMLKVIIIFWVNVVLLPFFLHPMLCSFWLNLVFLSLSSEPLFFFIFCTNDYKISPITKQSLLQKINK